MEQSWERGQEYRHLSLEQINDLIANSGHRAQSAELITEGKANTNYRLVLSDRQAILRLYQRDLGAARLEKAISDKLADEIPIPKFLALDESKGFALIEWKTGRTMETLLTSGAQDEVLSAATQIGSTLRQISSIKFSQAGFLNENLEVAEAWPSTAEGYFGFMRSRIDTDNFRARISPKLAAKISTHVEKNMPALEEAMRQPCLTHGDYKASNILIHEGNLTAILDWEFAHSGSWLMSVGQVFRHETSLPKGFEEGFANGFGEPRRDLAKTVDLVSLVDFLARDSSGPALIADVSALIEAST